MDIRLATRDDAPAISQLIRELALFCTIDPAGRGADGFLESISPAAIAGYIDAPSYRYRIATVDGEMAAVAAMRDNSHVFHLFVAPPFHRRGYARVLWELVRDEALARGNPGRFTVNSTLFAVPVYESFGFRRSGEQEQGNGIAWVPMKLGSDSGS